MLAVNHDVRITELPWVKGRVEEHLKLVDQVQHLLRLDVSELEVILQLLLVSRLGSIISLRLVSWLETVLYLLLHLVKKVSFELLVLNLWEEERAVLATALEDELCQQLLKLCSLNMPALILLEVIFLSKPLCREHLAVTFSVIGLL